MSRGIGYTQKSLSVCQCQQNSLPIFPVGFADNLHNAGITIFCTLIHLRQCVKSFLLNDIFETFPF